MSKKDKKPVQEELTEEDLKLKEDLEVLVSRLQDDDENTVKNALESMGNEIRTSTSSMTAVPKPLKFLRPHYEEMKEIYESMDDSHNKKSLADILSVISMTVENQNKDTLKYRLSGTGEDCSRWGHEYLRHLAGEIPEEYYNRISEGQSVDDILALVEDIVKYNVKHNAEPEACDLLLEIEKLEDIVRYIDEHNYQRICLYLVACSNYVQSPEDQQILRVVIEIYRKMDQPSNALTLALKLNDRDTIKEIFDSVSDKTMRRQLAFNMARQGIYGIVPDTEEDEELVKISRNEHLSKYFKILLEDLQITEAKEPEDIYKSHLSESRKKTVSAKLNLASSFVNAFLNAGSSTDKLLTPSDSQWIHNNKEHGALIAAASVGMIHLWDPLVGTSALDKFGQSSNNYLKAGYALGVGITCSNVVNPEYELGLNLISEYIESNDNDIRTSAALGLAIAYAGTNHEAVRDLLKNVFENKDNPIEVIGIFAVAIGLVCVGCCDDDLASDFIDTIIELSEEQMKSSYARLISLGLGLLYLGRKEKSELIVETLKAAPQGIGKVASLTVDALAYANSGSVVKIQSLLHECNEHLEKDNEHQAVAVLGIAMIGMAEEIGQEMTLRTFNHLLQYGELVIKRAVPLAIALNCIGNPNVTVMEQLSKLSHDHDNEVAMGAILGLGLIGVGTNHSRIAQLLRQLATYYSKEINLLYVVRIAQGLLHLGKGTITIKPQHSGGTCVNLASLGSIIAVLYACLDFNIIQGKSSHLLYLLTIAMRPRLLMCLDEDLNPKPVQVRVGQAIDVVGQPGKPKTITGFQTNNTPVLLSHNERAELATDQYIPYTDILEGFVIVRPNPESKHKALI